MTGIRHTSSMDDEPLVQAMPRRLLYALHGLITRLDLAVLTSIEEEGWFATRSVIAADLDGKEVRLAVIVSRGSEALVGPDGRLAHDVDIGPECEGLAALRRLAKATAEAVSGGLAHGVELTGYLNDDKDAALRHVFVLAYRARVPPGTEAPSGMRWMAKADLPVAVDPFSAKLADLLV